MGSAAAASHQHVRPAAAAQQPPAAAATAARPTASDPFAGSTNHDLLGSIQAMSVNSTNVPQLLGTATSAGSTSGGQRQHTRRSSSGSGGGMVKTAEDILKLYDAPQAAVGPFMLPVQQQGSGLGPAAMGPPGMMQQPGRLPGHVAPGFSHHPMSPMMPVSSTAAAAGGGAMYGQMQTNSAVGSPLGRLV